MSDAKGPVIEGDRLLLHPAITSLDGPAWGEVEIADYVEDPTSLPWNTGPDYPYRIGFRVAVVTGDGVGTGRGALWLNAEGRHATGGVLRIESGTERANLH